MIEKFIEILNKSIRLAYEKEKESHARVVGVYYPSSIGDCLRKQYYEFFEEKEPREEELTIFLTGKGVHEILAKVLNETVKVEATEMETSLSFGEAMLHGKVDILLIDFEGEKLVVELKTVSKIPKESLEKHVLQLQTYLHALNVEKGVLLYWDKRRGKKKAFGIIKDAKYYEILKERTMILHEHILNKKEPIKEAAMKGDHRTCLRCPYNSICKPLKMDIEENSELVVAEIDNVLFNTEERKKKCLEELNLPPDIDLRKLEKNLREEFFKLFYSEKYINLDSPIHEKIKEIDEEYLKNYRKIIIITNRVSSMRKVTEEQLTNIGIPYEKIYMRNEREKAIDFKATIIKLLEISGYKVMRIMDEEQTVEKIKKRLLEMDYS